MTNEKLYTKSEHIKELMNDEIELNQHIEHEASLEGLTVKQFAKRIAETTFDILLEEGTIIKVGNKYKNN